MHIDYLSDKQICDFVERDIKVSETQRASRCDGAALDLMGDLFARDHSRDDLHYVYEINEVKRKNDNITVVGYAVRVKCPGHRDENGAIWKGEFIYEFDDMGFCKSGNVSARGYSTKAYVKFVYNELPNDKKVEYKKAFLENIVKESENLFVD